MLTGGQPDGRCQLILGWTSGPRFLDLRPERCTGTAPPGELLCRDHRTRLGGQLRCPHVCGGVDNEGRLELRHCAERAGVNGGPCRLHAPFHFSGRAVHA
jgi:hypothetical protein